MMLVCVSFSHLSLLILRTCTVDSQGRLNQPLRPPPPIGLLQPSQRDIDYGDSSWPLYAMYSKIVQEEDNKIAENHQKSADGILVVVSPRVARPFLRFSIKYRLVYSLLPSQHCLPSQSQT